MSIVVDNIAEKTFDNFKKVTPALCAIAILTGMILFLPKDILEKMSLDELPVQWCRLIGVVFLLSIALIFTLIFFSIINKFMVKLKNRILRTNLKKRYKGLTLRQKKIVLAALCSEEKTVMLDKNSGDTIYLVNNIFLHMPEQPVSLGMNNEIILKYVPQAWLIDLYNEEPEFFD